VRLDGPRTQLGSRMGAGRVPYTTYETPAGVTTPRREKGRVSRGTPRRTAADCELDQAIAGVTTPRREAERASRTGAGRVPHTTYRECIPVPKPQATVIAHAARNGRPRATAPASDAHRHASEDVLRGGDEPRTRPRHRDARPALAGERGGGHGHGESEAGAQEGAGFGRGLPAPRKEAHARDRAQRGDCFRVRERCGIRSEGLRADFAQRITPISVNTLIFNP